MPRAKPKTQFVCESCGNDSPKWEGRCPSCGEWNSLGEVTVARDSDGRRQRARSASAPTMELAEVSAADLQRLQVSSGEVNRVLGGGIVPGSMVRTASR